MDEIRIVSTLEIITRLQAEVIEELFTLLSQHITATELDELPAVHKINRAAELRDDIKESW